MRLAEFPRLLVLAITLGTTLVTLSSFAQEPAPPKMVPAAQPAANAAMQDSMKQMMPGEAHKGFAKMTGKWTARMKIWNAATPTLPPMESTGETETRLVLGGRFLLEEAKGSVMQMPMQRMSILGYDNYRKVYTLVFYSSMETATNTATGTFDADGKILTLRGEFDVPQGKEAFKHVIRMESEDVRVFESYRILPDGKEVKVIEEAYTRVK